MNDRRGKVPASSSKPQLTDRQQGRVDRAREIVAEDIQDIAHGEDDLGMAAGYACGVMRAHVGFLLEVIGELAGGRDRTAATVAAFDRIAAVLADFDWEHGDRQYALEAIERIVLTGGGK